MNGVDTSLSVSVVLSKSYFPPSSIGENTLLHSSFDIFLWSVSYFSQKYATRETTDNSGSTRTSIEVKTKTQNQDTINNSKWEFYVQKVWKCKHVTPLNEYLCSSLPGMLCILRNVGARKFVEKVKAIYFTVYILWCIYIYSLARVTESRFTKTMRAVCLFGTLLHGLFLNPIQKWSYSAPYTLSL